MEKKEIEKVYFKKINQLRKFDKAYFDDDNPIISDKDYDHIKQEILILEEKYSYLIGKDNQLNFLDNASWLYLSGY